MRIREFLTISLVFAASGCAEKNEAPPAQDDAAGIAATSAPAMTPATGQAVMGSEAFIRHMHRHAAHLEGLNAALEAADLEAAKTPAYWLLRHEEVTGHPDDWQPHIEGMRDAARAVTEASEISVARAAAQRIVQGCRGCHDAAAVNVDLSGLKLD